MDIEQIEAIKLLELIEINTEQLKEFAYNKDYENKKDIEDLEKEMFEIYWAIEDYMDIKNRLETAEEEYEKIPYHFNNGHSFKNAIDKLKKDKYTFSKMDNLYEYLMKNLDEKICNISRTKLDKSVTNNYANITINVRYPNIKFTSTSCVYITCFGTIVRCSYSDQPMMQKLKCYDYSNRPKEYIDFVNENNRLTKEFDNTEKSYNDIIEYCNFGLNRAREILKDRVD